MKLRDPELNRQLKDAVQDYAAWPEWMKAVPAQAESDSTDDVRTLATCDAECA